MPQLVKSKRHLVAGIGGILICICIAAACFIFPRQEEEPFPADEPRLEQAVAQALLSDGKQDYLSGECSGEGHKILGYEKKAEEIVVYALTMYGEYGFENGHFVKISGSGVIPAVIYFDFSYQFKKITYPQDGAYYTESLKAMFPTRYYAEVLVWQKSAGGDLKKQEQRYAQEYLNSIGREADIGEYGDYEHILLTDVGVPVEVSNQMLNQPEVWAYPYWIGNCEKIEEGQRYIYELNYDAENKQIIYTKYQYDTKDIMERWVFDGMSGEKVEQAEKE